MLDTSARLIPIITDHAYVRGKERLGLSRKAVLRTAEKALNDGRLRTDFSGCLRHYLDSMFFHYGSRNLRIYGQHIFVFDKAVLVTVLLVPHQFARAAIK